ncbi:MAG: phospholipase D-like domain-containing protein [Elusimicrobiales bacterium]|nr:phospholipase D-like domain-containing protein [Elusimicrobiales bacterium]
MMRKYITCCSFALLLALPLINAGAQTLPVFPVDGPFTVPPVTPPPPPVPLPAVSSAAAVSTAPFSFGTAPGVSFSGQTDIAALLEGAIRASTSTVDIAVYGFTLPGVAQALVDAKDRGVAVRVICNDSHLFSTRVSEELQLLLDKGVNVRSLRGVGRYGIMHNKLGVYDGRLVSAGSFNWAVTANTANSENSIFIKDPHAIDGYKKYYEWMWNFARPAAAGPGEPVKDYGPPPEDGARALQFNGMLLPAYSFSPGGRTEANITGAVNFARERADIAVFSFYSTDIAQAVVNAHKRGVAVRVLVDRVQASQSEVGELLLKNGVPFRWSQGFAGKGVMHNKYAVLDSRLLMTGSFNWSVNAQENNFENMYYTMAPAAASAFEAQFENLFSKAETPTLEDLRRERALYRAGAGR